MFENKSLPNPQSTVQMEDRKMTATAFLSHAYKYHQCIDSKLEQIAVLRSLTQKITASYDSETVSRTRNVSAMQDSIFMLPVWKMKYSPSALSGKRMIRTCGRKKEDTER